MEFDDVRKLGKKMWYDFVQLLYAKLEEDTENNILEEELKQ